MNDLPLVSILMTAYNREEYISQAIESVLSSSFKNFELIIVDDGSKDSTVNIAKSFAEKDNRVRLYINERNLGDYPNRNQAAQYANGKYIKYLDSDDHFLEGGLEYCVNMMEENPEADWAMYHSLGIIAKNILTPPESINLHFFKKPFLLIGPGGTIMKKQFFLEMGMFPTIYGPANDLYFNLRAASKGSLLLIKNNFFHYRLHRGQERNDKYLYLVNLYNHLNDAVHQLDLELTPAQKKYILYKNKRRFLTNSFEYLVKTHDIKKIQDAIYEVNYTWSDAFKAVFQ